MKLTPSQEREWAEQCAKRKEQEQLAEKARRRVALIEAFRDSGLREAELLVWTLEEFLDGR